MQNFSTSLPTEGKIDFFHIYIYMRMRCKPNGCPLKTFTCRLVRTLFLSTMRSVKFFFSSKVSFTIHMILNKKLG